MRLFACQVLALFLSIPSPAADVPDPPFILPVTPIAPIPTPMPGVVLELPHDGVYVIQRASEFRVFDSPRGVVKVKSKKLKPGHIWTIDGKFVDGNGEWESRDYASPEGKEIQVAAIRPDGKLKADADVELILVPKEEGQPEVRIQLRVKSGRGPQPPPKPDPVPPDPPAPKPLNVSWIVIVEDVAQRTPETARVILDTAYWDGLKAKGVKMRAYAKNSPDVQAKGYWREFGMPYMLLLDVNGKDARTGGKPDAIALPSTTAGIDAILKGGK